MTMINALQTPPPPPNPFPLQTHKFNGFTMASLISPSVNMLMIESNWEPKFYINF